MKSTNFIQDFIKKKEKFTNFIQDSIQKKVNGNNSSLDGILNILQENPLPEEKAQEAGSRTILIPPEQDPQG